MIQKFGIPLIVNVITGCRANLWLQGKNAKIQSIQQNTAITYCRHKSWGI